MKKVVGFITAVLGFSFVANQITMIDSQTYEDEYPWTFSDSTVCKMCSSVYESENAQNLFDAKCSRCKKK